jgi:hypothetical protein
MVSPLEYLTSRRHLLNKDTCHLIVNKAEGKIAFVVEERDTFRNIITGKLKKSRVLDSFDINGTSLYGDKELAKFFRRTRFYFADPSVNDKIVAALMNFKAKVDAEIEKKADTKGNMKYLYERTVESNVPDTFILNVPIFEGYSPVKIEVVIGAEANSSEVKFYLESAILFELEEKEKEFILEDNIRHFREFGCAILYI